MGKKTLIIGASTKPDRYSYMAAERLLQHDHEIELLALRSGNIFGKVIQIGRPEFDNIDTVTMYVGAQRQTDYYEYIVGLKPKRVIFNPGTENEDFYEILKNNNIEPLQACTLVLLSIGEY